MILCTRTIPDIRKTGKRHDNQNSLLFVIINIFFSHVSDAVLWSAAADSNLEGRMKNLSNDVYQKEFFITQKKADDKWKVGLEADILEKVTLSKAELLATHTKDRKLMTSFLNNSKEDCLVDVGIQDLFPEGAPLVCHLKVFLLQNPLSWKFPTNSCVDEMLEKRSISWDSLQDIKVFELIIGTTTDDEINSAMRRFLHAMAQDRSVYPNQLQSLAVQTIDIDLQAFLDAKNDREQFILKDKPFITPILDSSAPKDSVFKFPARFVIGNGKTCMLSIKFNIVDQFDILEDKKKVAIKFSGLQESMKSVFDLLKRCVGVDIHDKRDAIIMAMAAVTGIKICIPKCIELGVLATLAGWSLQATDPFVLNLLTMGGIIPSSPSAGDRKWALNWDKLPPELKVYVIGELRIVHNVQSILLSMILRHFFPDPEVVCNLMRCSQSAFIDWFSKFIGWCLEEQVVAVQDRDLARTRAELILSLVPFNQQTAAPGLRTRTQVLISLLPHWPTVVYGGARYLHQVREFFLFTQYTAIRAKINSAQSELDFTREASTDMFVKILFGRVTTGLPGGRGTEQDGLCAHPELSPPVLDIDPKTILQVDLHKLAQVRNQSSSDSLREWARFHPMQIDTLLQRMDEERPPGMTKFWVDKPSLYEDLRLIKQKVLCDPAYTVPRLEEEIRKRSLNTVTKLEDIKIRQEKIFKDSEEREKIVAKLEERFPHASRSALEQEAYQKVPGNNIAKNRKKKEAKKRRTTEKKAQKLQAKVEKIRSKKSSSTIVSGSFIVHPVLDAPVGTLIDIDESVSETRIIRLIDSEDEEVAAKESPPRKVQFMSDSYYSD